ncbi:hypothetical protein JD969_05650 [Planctomycetota bacterium]|nr:hypothetical protein JD969_05650 [Planctomycetota bacterium]
MKQPITPQTSFKAHTPTNPNPIQNQILRSPLKGPSGPIEDTAIVTLPNT